MVASAILAVGLTALIQSFTAGTNTLRQNEQRSIAVILAQQKMAEIEGSEELEDGIQDGEVEGIYDRFQWQSEIQTLPDYPNLKQVRVIIFWQDGQRRDDVTLTTYVRVPPQSETIG
jgi:Tfp pilus assembly protein PilV